MKGLNDIEIMEMMNCLKKLLYSGCKMLIQYIVKVLEEQIFQPRILYPAKLAFTSEGQIKNFLDRQKLTETFNKL